MSSSASEFVERTAALMVAVGIGELDGDGKRIFPPSGFPLEIPACSQP